MFWFGLVLRFIVYNCLICVWLYFCLVILNMYDLLRKNGVLLLKFKIVILSLVVVLYLEFDVWIVII